jgi:hypothetical protein
MKFTNHHLEKSKIRLKQSFNSERIREHKTNIWNSMVDSELSDVTDDDCSIFPRILPLSYLKVIEKAAHDICLFGMRILSLPRQEVEAIVPQGPIRDFLIQELEVLRHRSGRITGSLRLDMAIVGAPSSANPPKLLELNEIGFDGLSRSSFIQKTVLEHMPELKKRVVSLDTTANEVHNMRRIGKSLARFQYDCYNWDEEYLAHYCQENNFDLRLISPASFGCDVDTKDFPLMTKERMSFPKSRLVTSSGFRPDAYQMSFALTLEDYKKSRHFFSNLVRSKTPHYGPFLTGLIASKMLLVMLSDASLRRKFLGSSNRLEKTILPSHKLEDRIEHVRNNFDDYVLKHVDGFGGEMVYLGRELDQRLKRIPSKQYQEWIVQEKTFLNLLQVHGINSGPRKVISDLGVFVQYDWSNGKFQNFKIGGMITRATNRSYKVNVSGGGIQVPVLFLKGT